MVEFVLNMLPWKFEVDWTTRFGDIGQRLKTHDVISPVRFNTRPYGGDITASVFDDSRWLTSAAILEVLMILEISTFLQEALNW